MYFQFAPTEHAHSILFTSAWRSNSNGQHVARDWIERPRNWFCPADVDDESLATGTSYMYIPGLLRYTPEVQFQVTKTVFLQKLNERAQAKARTDLEGQLLEGFYSGVDKRAGGTGPRASYYPLLMDSADRHPGTRSPRNALYVDGSVREAIEEEQASDDASGEPQE